MTTRKFICAVSCFAAVAACNDDGNGGASPAIASRLRECKLVSEGKVDPYVPNSDIAECAALCLSEGTCDELDQFYCERGTSDRVRDCQATCLGPQACASGEGTYQLVRKCDGEDDCNDGSDEVDCPAPQADGPMYCEKSGDRIYPFQRCNGRNECDDGTDERGCAEPAPLFTCKTGALGLVQQIAMERVCDLLPNCADGSDEAEEQGCAKLSCNN